MQNMDLNSLSPASANQGVEQEILWWPERVLLPSPQLVIRNSKALPAALEAQRGGYEIAANEAGVPVVIGVGGPEGHRHAAATLAQLGRSGKRLPEGMRIRDFPAFEQRIVHIDLKHYAPNEKFLLSFLEQMADWKLNTLLLEYEAKFPYSESLGIQDPVSTWTLDSIAGLQEKARECGVEIIPLVQTFGHLEFVLRHPRYADLRELPDLLCQICPLNEKALNLVCSMLDEVLAAHSSARFLHIGCDETAYLGACPRCRDFREKSSSLDLYLQYVNQIVRHVHRAGVGVMMWDDILRTQPEQVVKIPEEVTLVHWDYSPHNGVIDSKKPGFVFPPEPETFPKPEPAQERSAVPVYEIYRTHGYRVILAGCFTFGGSVPAIAETESNLRWVCTEAARSGCNGVMATNWAQLLTAQPSALHGLATFAELAWNPKPALREMITTRASGLSTEFDARFSRMVCGTEDPRLMTALRLISTGDVTVDGDGAFYPTPLGEASFVDPSLLVSVHDFIRQLQMFYRADWQQEEKLPDLCDAWLAKKQWFLTSSARAAFAELLQDQWERIGEGVRLLEKVVEDHKIENDFLKTWRLAGALKFHRIGTLLTLAKNQPVALLPETLEKEYRQLLAKFLSEADARELSSIHALA